MVDTIFESLKFPDLYEKTRLQPRIHHVLRIDHLDHDRFLQDVEPAGYPVVFRHSQSLSRKDFLQRLQKNHGRHVVQARIGEYGDPLKFPFGRSTKNLSLESFLVEMLQPASRSLPPYIGNSRLSPEMIVDLEYRAHTFHPADWYEPPAMWLGAKGTLTPLHKDGSDNFATHLFGAKHWVLFPVQDAPRLSMNRCEQDPMSDTAASRIDLRKPSGWRSVNLAGAVPVEVTVVEGETLYLPAGWSHFVESVESTLMVNTWLGRYRTPGVLRSILGDHPWPLERACPEA